MSTSLSYISLPTQNTKFMQVGTFKFLRQFADNICSKYLNFKAESNFIGIVTLTEFWDFWLKMNYSKTPSNTITGDFENIVLLEIVLLGVYMSLVKGKIGKN